MGTPVTVLVVDPTRGYQRAAEAGETLVDGDGNPILFPGYGPPVADIPALKAILPARRVDQQVRLVEDADPNTPGVDYPSNYAWDSTNTDADDPGSPGRPPAIVVPDDAPAVGRWIRVYSEVSPHHEIHEFGGRDEITIEDLSTQEYYPGSSSSSPGPGDPIRVLVPDGGGGVVWYDLIVESLDTSELDPNKVLQPDGAGGVVWSSYDPVIEGDLDMNCNDILYSGGIYFCNYGSTSGGSSGPTDLWIRPDLGTGEQLEYHAEGGHRFESPVWFTGTVNMLGNEITEVAWLGLGAAKGRLVFADAATDTITVSDATFVMGAASCSGLTMSGNIDMAASSITAVNELTVTGNAYIESGALRVGMADSVTGWLYLYGASSPSVVGGVAVFYAAADYATSYRIQVTEDDFEFCAVAVPKLTFAGADDSWYFGGDINMQGYDILAVSRLAFEWGGGSLSSSSGPGDEDAYIEAQGDIIVYHAAGGHKFESPAWFTGAVDLAENKITGLAAGTTSGDATRYEQVLLLAGGTMSGDIYLGANGIGRDASVLTFAVNGNGLATFGGSISVTGSSTATNHYVASGGYVGIAAGASFQFTAATPSYITASNHLYMGSNGIGNNAGVLTFAQTGAGAATFGGDVYLTANGIGNNASVLTFAANGDGLATFGGSVTATNHYVSSLGQVGISASTALKFVSGASFYIELQGGADLRLGAGGIGRDASVLTFAVNNNGLATFGGAVTAANYYGTTGFTIGISGNELLTFNDAGNITVTGTTNLHLGANGIGYNASVLTFAAGAAGAAAFTGDLNAVGHVETDDAFYLGDPDTDGSWRIRRDDWDLVFEHRDAEGWDECDRIPGCASSSSV